MARQMIFSPRKHGPATLSFRNLLPKSITGGRPIERPARIPHTTGARKKNAIIRCVFRRMIISICA